MATDIILKTEILEMVKRDIKYFLKETMLSDWIRENEFIYISGSYISYLISKYIGKDERGVTQSESCKSDVDYLPHDIDLYTTNSTYTINKLNTSRDRLDILGVHGCVVNFRHKKYKGDVYAQLITAQVDNFMEDVLANHDCDIVCVGYHPATDQIICHDRFKRAISTKRFVCIKEYSSERRTKKLEYRARNWYKGEIEYVGDKFGRFEESYGEFEPRAKDDLREALKIADVQSQHVFPKGGK